MKFGYPLWPILIYSTSFTTVTEDRHKMENYVLSNFVEYNLQTKNDTTNKAWIIQNLPMIWMFYTKIKTYIIPTNQSESTSNN